MSHFSQMYGNCLHYVCTGTWRSDTTFQGPKIPYVRIVHTRGQSDEAKIFVRSSVRTRNLPKHSENCSTAIFRYALKAMNRDVSSYLLLVPVYARYLLSLPATR